MVFILYKLYVLLPYTYPTPKLSPHRKRCISIFPQKTHSVWFISVLNYGDTENVLINHLLLVITMSYPCHYTNLCPHKPHKHAHTHTHTHTHTHIHAHRLQFLNSCSVKGCVSVILRVSAYAQEQRSILSCMDKHFSKYTYTHTQQVFIK